MFFEVTRCYHDRTIHWRYADDGDAIAMTLAITLNLLFSFESYAITVRACMAYFHGARRSDRRITRCARFAWVGSPHPLMYLQIQTHMVRYVSMHGWVGSPHPQALTTLKGVVSSSSFQASPEVNRIIERRSATSFCSAVAAVACRAEALPIAFR